MEVWLHDADGSIAATIPVPSFSIEPMAGMRALNHSGLWWSPAESGWGLNIVHHGEIVFASWFVYGADGRPEWYSLSDARYVQDRKVYEGIIYQSTGPNFRDCFNGDCPQRFDPSKVNRLPAGLGMLSFSGDGSGSFFFTIDGRTVYKQIERFTF